jgi:PAS domain S-box-containing protein
MQQNSFISLEQAVERNPIVVSPEIFLEEVVRLMSLGWASSCQLLKSDRATDLVASMCKDYVLAIAESRLLGIFTESDLVQLISSGTSWRKMTLGEVMNQNVVTLQSTSQDIFAVLNLLVQHQIHHLPIVDRNYRLQGLITQDSLCQALQLADFLKIRTVREVMTRAIHAFPTVSVLEVAQLMTDYRVSCIPITEARESDELLRPVGIVTETDIVQFQLLELNLAQIQAQTVMSTPLFLARPEDSLWAVHQQLERHLIRHLVVVGEEGELLGVITQNNLQAIAMWGTLTRSEERSKPEGESTESLEKRNTHLTNQIARQTSELQKQSQREQLVATIALRIRQSLDIQSILNTTVAEVRQLINADRVLIYRFEADDSGIVTNESVSDSQWSILDLVVKDSCFESAWIESFQQGHISSNANIERSNLSQCHLKFLKGFQVKANIAIPILLRDEDAPLESLWGLLIVHQCSAPREWQQSELELLQLLATQIAIAIQQAELYQQAQKEITRRKQVEAEIRKSESQLRTALDAAALGTWSWNIITNEVSLSERSQSLFGFNLGEFPGTLDAVLNRLHPQDRLKMDEKTFEAIASKELYDLETRVLLPNGNSRWLSARGHVLPNPEGQPEQMVGVIADISEKKQLEEQFLRHQRLESLGSLAGGIAHDLNNIFTPILMSVQLFPVTLAQIDPRSRELIQMVENNVKRGSALVQQILSFAKGIEGERGIVQVKHIITDIRQFAIETFPKSLEIRTNVSPNLWTIKGDAAQIYQILLNLAINAKDAMPDGGLLNISADNLSIDEQYVREHCQAQVGFYIVIAVSDTGSGIAEENRELIFEPFFSTKKETGGTGLGLATVKKIVQSHHGTIDVVSQIGQGTQFTIILPAVRTSETELLEHSAIPKGREELILVADDEATIREITRASLVTHNYRVITASNGIEAIASYVQNQTEVAVVLINMMMPGMDGTTAILTLQKIDPNIKIIAISGRHFSPQTLSDRNLHISRFLAKPYSTYTLLQTIKDVLTQHEKN